MNADLGFCDIRLRFNLDTDAPEDQRGRSFASPSATVSSFRLCARRRPFLSHNAEESFGSRAPVEFTHAICPDCVKRLYPAIMNG